MPKLSWIRPRSPRPAARRKSSARLLLETLEDRCVPAATFTVNSTADTAAPPAGTVTLRSAIAGAANGDTVVFSPALVGQPITLSSEIPITVGLTIQGLGQNGTVISGGNTNRIFNINTTTSPVVIKDLTLTRGNVATDGGAILDNNVPLTLDHVTVSNSTSSGAGGAVAVSGASGNLTATSANFSGNTASAGGAGVDVGAGSTTSFTTSVFNGNHGLGGSDGGGIDNAGTVTVTDSTFSFNTVQGTASVGGGLSNSGTATVTGSTFVGNAAGDGGGGVENVSGTLNLTNSTVVSNTVNGGGTVGGAGVRLGGGTGNLLNDTITNNIDSSGAAGSAGGLSIDPGATANVFNTVIASNIDTSGGAPDVRGTVTTGGTTDIVTNATGSTGIPAVSVKTAAQIALGPLQNNGGPTFTRLALAVSVLINAGNNAAAAALTTDQRGFLRVVGPSVDIGATEFQPPAVTVTLTVSPNATTPFHRAVTLTAQVTPTAAGTNNPVTGTVTFLVNGTVLGTAPVDATGKATFTTTAALPLPVGADQITARYDGDFNYGSAASAAVAHQVVRPIPTPVVFDPATATWYIRNAFSGGPPSVAAFRFGGPGDEPIMGDWDGDGVFGIGVFTPSTATFHLRNTPTAGAADFTFVFGPSQADLGGSSAMPVAGDWDGDGKWSVGAFAPSRGDWNLRNELTGGLPDAGSFLFGALGSKPVAGDWDGDGAFSQGVIEPDGTWKLKNVKATGTPDFTFAYGAFADQHVVGDWDGNGTWTPGVLQDNGSGALSWKLRNSNSGGAPDIAPFAYGASTFLGLVGDPDFPVLPQFASGGQGPGAGSISQADLNATVQAALARLRLEGLPPDVLGRLAGATAVLQPLAPGQLGGAVPLTNTIRLSPDGAGHGWFVDPTPLHDEEFAGGSAYPGSPAAGREDLLTVVMHELGHLAGLPDNDGSGLMGELLPEGTRRTDAAIASSAASRLTPMYTAPGMY